MVVTLAALLAVAEPVTLHYGDGDERTVDVYTPAPVKSSTTPRPVAVFLHGGVWQHGDRRDFHDVGAALAKRGFVVFVASYRLAPRSRWPAQLDDANAVIDLASRVASTYGGDAKRIVVVGHSAGAQMAAMAALHRKDIAALALLSGVFDLTAPLDEGQADGGFAAFIAPVFDRSALETAAPSSAWKSKLGIPILLATAERDYRAMRAQTAAMRAHLASLGENLAFVDAPDVDHDALVSSPQVLDAIASLVR